MPPKALTKIENLTIVAAPLPVVVLKKLPLGLSVRPAIVNSVVTNALLVSVILLILH